MIERFDARSLLDYIPPSSQQHKTTDNGDDLCDSEQSKVNYERYRDAMRPAKVGVSEQEHLELAKAIFSCDVRPSIAAYRRQALHKHLSSQSSADKGKDESQAQQQQSVIFGYNYETGEGSKIVETKPANDGSADKTEKLEASEDGLIVDEEDEDWFASATPQYAHWLRFMFKIPRKDEIELDRWAKSKWGVSNYCKQCRDEYRTLKDERASMKSRKAHLDLQAEGAFRGLNRRERKRLKNRLGVETDAAHDIHQISVNKRMGFADKYGSDSSSDDLYSPRRDDDEEYGDADDDGGEMKGDYVNGKDVKVEYITEFKKSDEKGSVMQQEMPMDYEDSEAFSVVYKSIKSNPPGLPSSQPQAKPKGKMTLQEKLKMKMQMQLHSSIDGNKAKTVKTKKVQPKSAAEKTESLGESKQEASSSLSATKLPLKSRSKSKSRSRSRSRSPSSSRSSSSSSSSSSRSTSTSSSSRSSSSSSSRSRSRSPSHSHSHHRHHRHDDRHRSHRGHSHHRHYSHNGHHSRHHHSRSHSRRHRK